MEEAQKNKPLTPYEDHGAQSRILAGSLDKASNFVKHFDSQANIILGFASAIALFAISMIEKPYNWSFVLLGAFSTISVIIGLYAIHPPRFMRKRGQEESWLYSKKVSSLPSATAYAEKLKGMMQDKDELTKQFSLEIYNLYTYYYKPKRFLFKLSRNFLIIGIVSSLILFIFTN